jgi:hypothetical protein
LQRLGFVRPAPFASGALKTAIKRLDCAPACRFNPEGRGAKQLPYNLSRIQQSEPENNFCGASLQLAGGATAVAVFCNEIENIKHPHIPPVFQLWKQWKKLDYTGLTSTTTISIRQRKMGPWNQLK